MPNGAEITDDELVSPELFPEGLPPLKDPKDNPLGLFDEEMEKKLGIHTAKTSKEHDEVVIEDQVVTIDSSTEPEGLLHLLQKNAPSLDAPRTWLGSLIKDRRSKLGQWAQQLGIL